MARLLIRDLTPGQTYKVQVRATRDATSSEWSRIFTIATNVDTVSPSIPTGLALTMNGTTFVATWNPVTTNADTSAIQDFDHYELEISSTGDPDTSLYKGTSTRFDIPFERNGAIFGTPQANIRVRVAAVDSMGNTSGYSTYVSATNPAPAAPTTLNATAAVDSIGLSWTSVADTDLKEYHVYVGTTSGFTPSSGNMVYKGPATSFTHTNTTYSAQYYKVSAVDVFGSESTFTVAGPVTPNSSFSSDSTPPAVPTSVAITAPTFDAVNQRSNLSVTWTASTSTDVQTYDVRYSKTGSGAWNYLAVPGDQTAVTITGVEPGQTYYVQVRAVDFSANKSAFVNAGTYPITSAADAVAPSTPNAPTVTTDTMKLQIVHDRKQADGTTAMESDVDYYEAYASTSSGFTPGTSTMLGTIRNGPVVINTFQIPANASSGTTQNWYAKVIAVDKAGNKSSASAASSAAAVGLVGDLNITSVSASKMVANSIFTADLGVQSTFTLGDATHDGSVQSYGYAAGTTGFKLAKSGLEINQGSIAAPALKIQNGANLLPPQWADFEFAANYYVGKMSPSTILAGVTVGANAKFGGAYLGTVWGTAGANPTVYLGATNTDYNVNVEAGATYIVSAYVRTAGAVATVVRMNVKYSNAATALVTSLTPTVSSAAWTRISGVITVPAGVTGLIVWFDSTTWTSAAGFDVDGVQVEPQTAGLTTPSQWKPSSTTSVDGGIIRTGEVRSTQVTTVNGVDQPLWSINLAGNAQFGNASVRGFLIVGNATDDDNGQSYMASGNYVVGTTGWKVDSSGVAEFQDGTFRGDIQAISGTFSGVIQISDSGMLVTGDQSGPRLEQDTAGLRLFSDTTTLAVQLPTDPGLTASFKGNLETGQLIVNDNMTINGLNNILTSGTALTLTQGTRASTAAPTVVVDYNRVSINTQYLGWRRGAWYESGYLYSAASLFSAALVGWNVTTGAAATSGIWTDTGEGNVTGLTKIGTTWYVMTQGGPRRTTGSANQTWVQIYNSTGTMTGEWQHSANPAHVPTIGTDGTNLFIAQLLSDNTLRIIRCTPSTGAITATYTTAVAFPGGPCGLSSLSIGTFDFGATRYIVTSHDLSGSNAKAYAFSLSGTTLTHQANDSWPIANKERTAGLTWDGTNFYSLSADSSYIYKYSTINWTTESSTWWASYAWRQTTNSYLTPQSARAKFTMTKRARVTLTSSAIPNTATPSTDPDAVSFYLGRGTSDPGTAAMWRQTDPSAAVISTVYSGATFTGTNPVTSNTFPGAAPSVVQSVATQGDGTPMISIGGDGVLRTGDILMGATTSTTQYVQRWRMKNTATTDAYERWDYIYNGTDSGFASQVRKNGSEVARMQMTSLGELQIINGTRNAISASGMRILDSGQTGSLTTNSTTTYNAITGGPSVVFTAPPSGIVAIAFSCFQKTATAGTYCFVDAEVRAGSTVGSGTAVRTAAAFVLVNAAVDWLKQGTTVTVSGLTAGSQYNVQLKFASQTAGTTVSASIAQIVVIPSL